jgi:hypothetical protein
VELLWIKFKLGTFMPQLPLRNCLTQTNIRQIDRAFRAAALLRQDLTILDTVWEAGYFDQPHLTHSLKQWVG